ncbi:MFS transporter [Terribacillus saccharophilus]|uniref:MFS transporter n=1 Tax=Terribacillus saccharophilus TaxID=361277 RepID=UPI000BA75735|nr:MFS transporter [Terribacillus saccharophilus]PAF22331.1 MFS transporter [Terribacillus saccharophilus]PAF34280.1 MFS transporter [Terribacillus saccharophilus]
MKKNNNSLLILILTVGVFGIINTEMGIIGILPSLAGHYDVSVSQAGLLVSLFALAVAISGPTMPILFSGINRKTVMILVLGIFVFSNIVSIFTTNFTVSLIARVIPAFFHPVYCALALSTASSSVAPEEAPKAVSRVVMGVSAGMIFGLPVTSFIANSGSLELALSFFAIVNILALLATILFVPSMPVKEKTSYGSQISILKYGITWLAILAVICLNSAIFGVYSYFSEYMESVTNITGQMVTGMLFIFGFASIIGNILAGKLLSSKKNIRAILFYPFALGITYLLLFLFGELTIPTAIIVLLFGMLMGIGNNICQYWITSAAPKAPDFANGLFLAFGNLGTTIGTSVGGLFIASMGTRYVVISAWIFLLLAAVFIALRVFKYHSRNAATN